VSVGVGDVSGHTEVVLQILPGGLARQIFDNQAELGSTARRVSATAAVTIGISAAETFRAIAAASTVALAVSAAAVAGELDAESASSGHFLSVEILNCIFGVPVVVEVDKAEAVFDGNFAKLSVAFEELLDVALATIGRDVPDENSLSRRHF